MSTYFTLSDIDPEVPPRKEVIRIEGSSFKLPQSRSRSKKRKVEEIYDLDDPAANLLTATEIMLEKYAEKVETIDDLIATLKKSSVKLEKAKRKIKVLKAMLSRKTDSVTEEGTAVNSILMDEAKRDATIAVLESKILMAMQAAENGLETAMWDVQAWRNRLAEIKEDHAPSPSTIIYGGSKAPKRKATKAPKSRITDAAVMIKGEASNPMDNEDPTMAGDMNDDDSLGKDGI